MPISNLWKLELPGCGFLKLLLGNQPFFKITICQPTFILMLRPMVGHDGSGAYLFAFCLTLSHIPTIKDGGEYPAHDAGFGSGLAPFDKISDFHCFFRYFVPKGVWGESEKVLDTLSLGLLFTRLNESSFIILITVGYGWK